MIYLHKYIFIIFIILLVILLGFEKNETVYPERVYAVYLAGEKIGMVADKEAFEKYIDKKADDIKERYQVEHVYHPATLDIKQQLTFQANLLSNEEVFNKLEDPLTIDGYQIKIFNEEEERKIYVTQLEIFEQSVRDVIVSFIGEEEYEKYLNENQSEIKGIGSRIENIYLEDNITYRKIRIPVTEDIYISPSSLAQKLLFGPDKQEESYIVKAGDTIESVAFAHEISPEEFLISNPEFTSKNNLLYESQEVLIGMTDPQLAVVVEQFVIEDVKKDYQEEVRYDKEKTIGYSRTIQKGEPGVERLSRNVRTINGVVAFSDLLEREEITPAINEITVRGKREVPHVATTYGWTWPTEPGWVITSGYEYRINPFTRRRELHEALDIAIGYGARIYAANNGIIHHAGYHSSYGYYVIIRHQNEADQYTLYAHLSRYIVTQGQAVEAGALIGYMGSSGSSTGPHLHFEVWVGEPYAGGYRVNPWSVLR